MDAVLAESTRYRELAAALAGGGYRLTPQRAAVLSVLSACDTHPTVDQVYALARERCPTTSRATVYNTVSVLKGLGEVLELEFGAAGSRYDGRLPHAHAHLICTVCGRIDDYPSAPLEAALTAAAASSNYAIVAHRLDFYGTCAACQAGESAYT